MPLLMKQVFQCSKGQEDRPAPIPIPDDEESDQESEIPPLKSSDCFEWIPISAPRGNSPQPPPGFCGYGPYSYPSEPSEPSEKDMPQSSPDPSSPSQHLLNNVFHLPNLVLKGENSIQASKLELRTFIRKRDIYSLTLHLLHLLLQENEYDTFLKVYQQTGCFLDKLENN